MTNYSSTKARPNTTYTDSVSSAVSVGAFFIIISVIYIIHLSPQFNLWNNFISFLTSFTLAQVPNTTIFWPAPSNPAGFTELYSAFFQFCIATGIVNAILLILRFWFNSSIDRKAETIGNIVFWFGTGYLITVYLTSSVTLYTWFVFWIWVLMVLGWSLIARAFAFLAKRAPSKT